MPYLNGWQDLILIAHWNKEALANFGISLELLVKAFRVVRPFGKLTAHRERQMANARDSTSVRPELVEGQLLPLFIDAA